MRPSSRLCNIARAAGRQEQRQHQAEGHQSLAAGDLEGIEPGRPSLREIDVVAAVGDRHAEGENHGGESGRVDPVVCGTIRNRTDTSPKSDAEDTDCGHALDAGKGGQAQRDDRRSRGDQRHHVGIDTAGGEEREEVGHEIAEYRADEVESDRARPENRQPATGEADGEQRQSDAADDRRGNPAIGQA